MRTPLLALGVALAALAPGAVAAPAPAPQVTDLAGDANFVNGQGSVGAVPAQGNTPVSQAYADVLSVQWQTTFVSRKVGRKVLRVADGFTVTAKLSAAPTPPTGTTLVYRMLGTPLCGDFFGVVYYTSAGTDPNIPQSAIRDNCTGATRLTKTAMPVIKDSTMTWRVRFTELPKEVKPNTMLTDLRFEVREIENFPPGVCTPAGTPSLGAACGLGFGLIDEGAGTTPYKFGS